MLSKRDSSKGYVLVKANEDKSVKVVDKKKLAEFQEEAQKRSLEARRAEQEELGEREEDEEEELTPQDIDDRRASIFQDYLVEEYDMSIEFGMSPQETLDSMKNIIGEALMSSLGMSDVSHDFMDKHDQTPIITPSLMGLLQDKAESAGLNPAPYEMTVDNEQIPHHIGMLDEYKVKRPDKAMGALKHTPFGVHPLSKQLSGMIDKAIESGRFDLEDAKEEEIFRRNKRGWGRKDRERAAEKLSEHFNEKPPYVEDEDEDEDDEWGAPDDPADEWGAPDDPDGPKDPALARAYEKLFADRHYQPASKRGYGSIESGPQLAASSALFDGLMDDVERRVQEKRDELSDEEDSPIREHQFLKEVYDELQERMNIHASKALNTPYIGSRKVLSFGRGAKSGSEPIMTPTWKRIGNEMGIKTNIRVNSPDVMTSALLANAPDPFDNKYRRQIMSHMASMMTEQGRGEVDISSIHPAITNHKSIMREALEISGNLDLMGDPNVNVDVEGREADREHPDERRVEEGEAPHHNPMEGRGDRGQGMGGLDPALGSGRDGKRGYFTETAEEMKAMPISVRDKRWARYKRQLRDAVKQLLHGPESRSGFGSKSEQQRSRKADAKRQHSTIMNELEHYTTLFNEGSLSREDYIAQTASMMAYKGFDMDSLGSNIDDGLKGGPEPFKMGYQIPEVPEGHYLYADPTTKQVLTDGEREDKLKSFINTILGTTMILNAARKKLDNVGGEGSGKSILHSMGDLRILMHPPEKPSENETETLEELEAAGLDEKWLTTRLTQNADLKRSLRELNIPPHAFLDQIAETFGGDLSFDNLLTGVTDMVKRNSNTTGDIEDSNKLNLILAAYIRNKHGKEMHDIAYHEPVIQQYNDLVNGKLDEGDHTCKGCIGSLDRTTNTGGNRGGRGGKLSPYVYDSKRVPMLFDVPFGNPSSEDNPDPEERGGRNLISILHDVLGRSDENEDWEKTERQAMFKGKNQLIREIAEHIEKRSGATEDLARKYNLGIKYSKIRPKGIAKDLEENPLATEVWKHAFPSTEGVERREAHDNLQNLIKDQKKDLLGAFNLLIQNSNAKGRSMLTAPTVYDDGNTSTRDQIKMIKDLIAGSGQKDYLDAKKKYNRFMKDRTRDVRKRPGETITTLGYKSKLGYWEDLKLPKIGDLQTSIARLKEQGDSPKLVKKAVAELKMLMNNAQRKLNSEERNVAFSNKLGVEMNRWKAETVKREKWEGNEANDYQGILAKTKKAIKYQVDNGHIATLVHLYPQMTKLVKEQGVNPELGRLEQALEELHANVYENDANVNTQKQFNYNSYFKWREGEEKPRLIINSVKATERHAIGRPEGLTGKLGETQGSAISYAGGAYHAPMPTSIDEAVAMLREHGKEVTPEILEDLTRAKRVQDIIPADDDMADMVVDMREREKIISNQRYVDDAKKNHSNPTGSQTRCGTCAGNTTLTQDEMVSYAKAHYEELQGHTISTSDMRKWITKHGRPAGHQSYDEHDILNESETGPLDHSEYACPDCQHWDAQVNGWVSDGICGQCLGDGKVNKGDKYLNENIGNHTHKAGVSMTPERLAALTDMQELRGKSTGTTKVNNMMEQMIGTKSLSPLGLHLGRMNENEIPELQTRDEYMAAQKKIEERRNNSSVVSASKVAEQPNYQQQSLDFPKQRIALPSNTLRDARHDAGKKALVKHLNHMRAVATNSGIDDSKLLPILRKIIAIEKHSYSDLDNHDHVVHDKIDAVQGLINNHVRNKDAERELLGGDTKMYNEIQNMEEGKEKQDKMKRYKKSLYRTPSWPTPLLSHRGGRMVTKWEDKVKQAFDSDADPIHHNAYEVENFFAPSAQGKNRIRHAFELVSGGTWGEIKKQEDKEIMEFLKDFDELIEQGESPLQKSQGGKLSPNNTYTNMREETGMKVPDDDFDKDLPDGNIMHKNLEKHSENAENWLRGFKTRKDENGKVIRQLQDKDSAIHNKIPNEIAKVAKKEFIEMARMRAMTKFFAIQTHPGQDRLLEGMKKILNSDGEPMTLQEYKDSDNIDNVTKSQLDYNINQMIVDKKGIPIEDYEDKTGLTQLKNYYIVGKISNDSDDSDQELQKYSFDDYLSERREDADLNLQEHTSKDFAAKVLELIQANQEERESKSNDKYDGLSKDDATKIVENANKFYDMFHYPNLYLENELHTLVSDYGLDSLSDVNEFLGRNPELYNQFSEAFNMIKTIHPCWSPQAVEEQTNMDEAEELERAEKKRLEEAAAFSAEGKKRWEVGISQQQLPGGEPISAQRMREHHDELKAATGETLRAEREREQEWRANPEMVKVRAWDEKEWGKEGRPPPLTSEDREAQEAAAQEYGQQTATQNYPGATYDPPQYFQPVKQNQQE